MTVQQAELWHDDITDAIGSVVQALGGTKRVAAELWPALKPDTAYARLRACLNEEKPEKLAPEEVLWLAQRGQQVGAHAIMQYICREAGYDEPRPRSPSEIQNEAALRMAAALEEFNRWAKLHERQAIPGLKVAK